MKLRWLGILLTGFSFVLSISAVDAACQWALPSCAHLDGSPNITFNTFEYSRSKYFWNTNQCISDTDLGSYQPGVPGDCILWRNESINGTTNTFTDAQCNAAGISTPPGFTFGCACLEPTCVVSYVNGDNRIKEPYFTSARRCVANNCAASDPVGNFPNTPGYQPVPEYLLALPGTLNLGDKIRVQVYSHNNAKEQFPGDPNYSNYMANNTEVELNFAMSGIGTSIMHSVGSIISSTNATPTSIISPFVDLPSIVQGNQYKVVGAWHHYNTATSAGAPTYATQHFTLTDPALTSVNNVTTFNLGNHASSYGNVHRVYFDLEVVATPVPNLTLNKTATPAPPAHVSAGDIITYNIAAANTGNVPLLNSIVITDILDPNVTFVSGGTGVTHSAGTVTITFPAGLAIGATLNTTFDVTVNTAYPTPTQVCNIATSSLSGTISVISNQICHAVDATLPAFDFDKTATPAAGTALNPGDQINYDFTIVNTSNVILPAMTVTDTLDSSLTYISGDPGVSHASGVVSLTFPAIPVGGMSIAGFVVEVNANTPTPSQICNAGMATDGGLITVYSDSVCHNILQGGPATDYMIEKSSNPTDGSNVNPGDTITYTISVDTGNVPLPNLVVTDVLNPNVTFVSSPSSTVSYNLATHTVTLTFPPLAAGIIQNESFDVQVNANALANTTFCNEANGLALGVADLSNDVCHTIVPVFVADHTLVKSAAPAAGTTLFPGDTVTYTVVATNIGTASISTIIATDVLSPDLTFVSGDPGVSNIGGIVTLDFGALAVGTTNTLSFAATVNANAQIPSNICNIAFNGTTITSNQICHPVADEIITLIKHSDISDGDAVTPGQIFSYHIEAINNTNAPLSVTVTDALDPNVTYVGSPDPAVVYDSATHTLTLKFASIPAHAGMTIPFEVEVLNPGAANIEICNHAEVDSTTTPIITPTPPTPTTPITLVSPQTSFLNTVQEAVKNIFAPIKNLFKNLTSSLFDIRTIQQLTAQIITPNIVSNEICNPVDAVAPIEILKKSNPADGANVNTGDLVTYSVAFNNNSGAPLSITLRDPIDPGASFVSAGTISITDPAASGTITFDSNTSTVSLDITNLGDGESMNFEFDVEITTTTDTQVCNEATTDFNGIPYISTHICVNANNGGTGNTTSITKSISPATGPIANGDILTYTIRFESDETTTFSTILNDTLDTNVIYIGNEIITSADPLITGTVTHDGAAHGGLVTLDVVDMPQGGWIEYNFDVTVDADPMPTEICNQVSDENDTWFSNIACISNTTSGGGGSGGGSVQLNTIGICTTHPSGSLSCIKRSPHPTNGKEAYYAWKDCKKARVKTLEECTHEWADEVGLLAIGECHPDNIATSQTSGGWREDWNTNGYVWFGTKPGDHDNECDATLLVDDSTCTTSCAQIAAEIEKTTSTPAVAKNENADYNVEFKLRYAAPFGEKVRITDMKIYDLTIPAASGWVYDHVLEDAENWEWRGAGNAPQLNYFAWTGGRFELEGAKTFNLDYSMNTALTIKSDTAQISNVAFAVVEYEIETIDGVTTSGQYRIGGENLCETSRLEEILGSASSLGSTAKVKIIRPFVEVRGGGNLGVVEKLTDTTENPFGGLNTAEEDDNELSTGSGEILTGKETGGLTETDSLWEEYGEQASDTISFFGTNWATTPDDAEVYFYTGDVTLSGGFEGSKTFVVDGTLIINKNFEPQGFGAFVANKIVIGADVTKIVGVFIADGGAIMSTDISDKQLVISGALMGDATDLLENRKFIGDTSVELEDMVLEPSIKINYDLRLLDATPPALELFLSEDWTQTAE